MPLRNRVDPFGRISAVSARGLFTGNRGIIHDPDRRDLVDRRWTTKAWIVCRLEHPSGRKRDVMGRNAPGGGAGWTELFFLDEPTALAAGHRPCFFCRRQDALKFASAFAKGQERASMTAGEIDGILHAERLASNGAGVDRLPALTSQPPDGTMIESEGEAYLVRGGEGRRWSFYGYGAAISLSLFREPRLLTPPSTVAALACGYRPWLP